MQPIVDRTDAVSGAVTNPCRQLDPVQPFSAPIELKRILVVDDDEFILEILEKIVHREGFEVASVLSAKEALQKLENGNFDAVISDIVMPDMDGIELLKEVKEKHPSIKMLMITGHTGKYGSESVMDLGADGFVSKPFKNIEITRTLHMLINRV